MEIKTDQKDHISFEGLFLHDTQMAQLFRLQRALGAAFARLAPVNPLPFSFMIPFYPAPDAAPDKGAEGTVKSRRERTRLGVGALTDDSGWIVLPVSPGGKAPCIRPSFPGYPPLPETPGFILGYAGILAEKLIAEIIASDAAREASEFTVTARYRATVTVAVTINEGSVSVAYSLGKANWDK